MVPIHEEHKTIYTYVPHEALQGEEVPAFAKWSGREMKRIEVDFSAGLEFNDIYNVLKEDYVLKGRKLVVSKVEVNGYLGLLFDSTRLADVKDTAKVSFHFETDDEIEHKTSEITLYHPLLTFESKSSRLLVDPRKKVPVTNPLTITKKGDGTVVCWVASATDSEVVVGESEPMAQFREQLQKDVNTTFSKIAKDFPSHEAILKESVDYLSLDPNFQDPDWNKGLREFVQSLEKAYEADPKFAEVLREQFAEVLMKNLHNLNFFEQLKQYLLSIHAKKVLLQNASDALKLKQGINSAKLKLEYSDLTFEFYPPLELNIEVRSPTKGEILIYELLQWE